jgi:hypothetical protein
MIGIGAGLKGLVAKWGEAEDGQRGLTAASALHYKGSAGVGVVVEYPVRSYSQNILKHP